MYHGGWDTKLEDMHTVFLKTDNAASMCSHLLIMDLFSDTGMKISDLMLIFPKWDRVKATSLGMSREPILWCQVDAKILKCDGTRFPTVPQGSGLETNTVPSSWGRREM